MAAETKWWSEIDFPYHCTTGKPSWSPATVGISETEQAGVEAKKPMDLIT